MGILCVGFMVIFLLQNAHTKNEFGETGIEKLEEVFAWKQLTFDIDGIDDDNNKTEANDDFFIQYNNVPMGIERWKDKLFLGVPRRRPGIPSTLNYISLSENKNKKSPKLKPYPDYKTNNLSNEDSLISVYRPRVDACDRLWMVDTGVTETQDMFKTKQRPSIVIFDLNTDKIIHRYFLRNEDYTCADHSGFISIAVDVTKDNCDEAFAYLPDLSNGALVVYSLKENTSWRVRHNYFHLEPDSGSFNFPDVPAYEWSDGIFSVALGPVEKDGHRTAYFHPMISTKERTVNTAILKNQTLATRSYHGNDFDTVGNRGISTQSTTHAVHQATGTMVWAQIGNSALTCWRTDKLLTEKSMDYIAQDSKKFFYPSDMKIDSDDNIWIITNKLPVFIYGRLNTSDVNFRVYRTPIEVAFSDTKCKK